MQEKQEKHQDQKITYFKCKDRVYEWFEDELFKGYIQAELPELESAGLSWKGGNIPFKLWEMIIGFMRVSFDKEEEETLIFLMFNTNTHKWDAWAPPQFMEGMAVSADPKDPNYDEQRNNWGEGWVMAGSVHHHCTAAAFASGTDNKDELQKDGIHFTLGNMDKSTMSIDCRMTYNGIKYKGPATEFINIPPLEMEIESGSSIELFTKILCSITGTEFPEYWMTNLKKRVLVGVQHGQTQLPGKPSISGVMTDDRWEKWKNINKSPQSISQMTKLGNGI